VTVGKRKRLRSRRSGIDVKVTRLVADDERLHIIVEALAEVGIAHVQARFAAARPLRSPHRKRENDGVA